jgi:hypothetical protein
MSVGLRLSNRLPAADSDITLDRRARPPGGAPGSGRLGQDPNPPPIISVISVWAHRRPTAIMVAAHAAAAALQLRRQVTAPEL